MCGDTDLPYSRERRVKAFLDACAYLLLRDNPEGTVSHYKDIMNGKREIPVSSCPQMVDHLIYSGRQPPEDEGDNEFSKFALMLERLDARAKPYESKRKKKPKKKETQFQRAERIRKEHPGCRFFFCRVNTENRFEYNGVYYRIDESVEVYQPKQTREGALYDMDEITVVRAADGKLYFYDQKMYPLDREAIRFA